MAAVGGSIESISIRGRLFPVAADADATRDLGGFTVEVQSNGDGNARILKTRKPWALGGVVVEINDDRADQEFLQEIQNGNEFVAITITFASGTTYQARGTLVDAIEAGSANATATIALQGPGEMTQQ